MNRKQALAEVGKCVLQDRNASYGTPEDNFNDIAARWNIYLKRRGLITANLTKADVAAMMIDVKLARMGASPNKLDNWIDAAGYAVCGAEVIEEKPLKSVIIEEEHDA